MNSDDMLKASMNTLQRMKTIDDYTKKITDIKEEIKKRGEVIQHYAKGLLRNMTPKKVITDIKIKAKWNEQQLVFANYGIGLQSKYSSNATSLMELDWQEFIKINIALVGRDKELLKFLKPEKLETLKRFLKNAEKLRINRGEQQHLLGKDIKYVSREMLSSRGSGGITWGQEVSEDISCMTRNAKIGAIEYYENKLLFLDENGDKIKVSVNNPKLEDALILEQIFDETKELLENEVARLEQERENYDYFISELKKDFSNEILIMELAK